MSMTAFRVAMPNRVTNPTSDPSDSNPPVRNTAKTPPTRAKGRVASPQQRPAALAEGEPQEHHDTGRGEEAVAQQLAAGFALGRPGASQLGVDAARPARGGGPP